MTKSLEKITKEILENFILKTKIELTPTWESIVLVDDDWDSETKINELNKIDAEFNEVPIEKIIELLK